MKRFTARAPAPALALALALALLLAACGSSNKSSSPSGSSSATRHLTSAATLCLPEVRELIATKLSVHPSTVSTASSVGSNGNPQCTFTAETARHQRVAITANEYTGPQPYFILARTEEEAAQVFTPTRLSPAPQTIMGLGLEAAWFPATKAVMATDAIRLIDVTFRWPGASQAQQRTRGSPWPAPTRRRPSTANSWPRITRRPRAHDAPRPRRRAPTTPRARTRQPAPTAPPRAHPHGAPR